MGGGVLQPARTDAIRQHSGIDGRNVERFRGDLRDLGPVGIRRSLTEDAVMSTKFAELETTRGKITVELFDRDCPETVDNFERLANAGFYDGLTFHRVVPNVSVQTGDPLSRDLPVGDGRLGEGGPGYT